MAVVVSIQVIIAVPLAAENSYSMTLKLADFLEPTDYVITMKCRNSVLNKDDTFTWTFDGQTLVDDGYEVCWALTTTLIPCSLYITRISSSNRTFNSGSNLSWQQLIWHMQVYYYCHACSNDYASPV